MRLPLFYRLLSPIIFFFAFGTVTCRYSATRQIWAEELASPTILQPGAYRNICIELEIHGLAVGSVIVSLY